MITITSTASGKEYTIGELRTGHHQYMDRLYQFSYIPDELKGCVHIMPHGDDKMLSEKEWCFTIETDRECDVYVLYPDKQPVLPKWLESYERTRMNVTRFDSMHNTLKGYFSLYHKHFAPGEIRFYGSSPDAMLAEDWYVETGGNTYCMYSVAVKEL